VERGGAQRRLSLSRKPQQFLVERAQGPWADRPAIQSASQLQISVPESVTGVSGLKGCEPGPELAGERVGQPWSAGFALLLERELGVAEPRRARL